MTLTITGTAVDGKTHYTFKGTTLKRAKSEWSSYRAKMLKKRIVIPNTLDIVYSGDIVLIYPEWISSSAFDPQAGSGGFEIFGAGTDRSYPITVTSDEYKYSIMNGCYIAILTNNQSYKPTIVNNSGFHLVKVGVTNTPLKKTLHSYMYLHKVHDGEEPPIVTFDYEKLCDIYDDPAYTIGVLCNRLAEINRRFSFSLISATKFTFHFSVNSDSKYIPLLYTENNSFSNVFTPDYFTNDMNYYAKNMNWWYNTWSQVIDLTKRYNDEVVLDNRTYFADGSKRISTVTLYPENIPK